MDKILRDPITGQGRLLAPNRATRPHGERPTGCPFCAGNEEQTPPEIDRVQEGALWQARAVPNLYPLVDHHEVLIPTPRHVTTVRDLTVEEWESGLRLWLQRIDAYADDSSVYSHLYINDGKEAGASLPHTHAQLVVVPRAPETDALVHGTGDDCAICAAVANEELSVAHAEGMHLMAHPGPRTGGTLLLAPESHTSTPTVDDVEVWALAMRRAVTALDGEAFNLWLVADPHAGGHWYIELVPRTARLAGVELALNLGVSLVTPEAAADAARDRLAATVS
jgi:UDPglucose--hexose-1-phosphate uridylyltransferase